MTAEGPMLQDVVKRVDVPKLLPTYIPEAQPAMEEAQSQGASFSRIADALECMVSLSQAHYLQQARLVAAYEDEKWWSKMLIGTVYLVPILTVLFMWAISI